MASNHLANTLFIHWLNMREQQRQQETVNRAQEANVLAAKEQTLQNTFQREQEAKDREFDRKLKTAELLGQSAAVLDKYNVPVPGWVRETPQTPKEQEAFDIGNLTGTAGVVEKEKAAENLMNRTLATQQAINARAEASLDFRRDKLNLEYPLKESNNQLSWEKWITQKPLLLNEDARKDEYLELARERLKAQIAHLHETAKKQGKDILTVAKAELGFLAKQISMKQQRQLMLTNKIDKNSMERQELDNLTKELPDLTEKYAALKDVYAPDYDPTHYQEAKTILDAPIEGKEAKPVGKTQEELQEEERQNVEKYRTK